MPPPEAGGEQPDGPDEMAQDARRRVKEEDEVVSGAEAREPADSEGGACVWTEPGWK